jgi:hypothetical protein
VAINEVSLLSEYVKKKKLPRKKSSIKAPKYFTKWSLTSQEEYYAIIVDNIMMMTQRNV